MRKRKQLVFLAQVTKQISDFESVTYETYVPSYFLAKFVNLELSQGHVVQFNEIF